MVQEVDHLVEDSVHSEHSVDQSEASSGASLGVLSSEASKQVALKKTPWWLATAYGHAVIPWDKKMSPVGSTQNATGALEMPRFGIG